MEQKQEIDSFYYVNIALQKFKQYWYVFLFSISLCLASALAFNWYLRPMYEVGSVILIDSKSSDSKQGEFMKSFEIFDPSSDIHREIQKMKSLEMIYEALVVTNARIGYYGIISKVKKTELYKDSPFTVTLIDDHVQPINVPFEIKSESVTTFSLHVENSSGVTLYKYTTKENQGTGDLSLSKTYNYGDTIRTNECCFIVYLDSVKLKANKQDTRFFFVFNNLDKLKYRYKNELKIEQVGRDISAVSVRIKVQHIQQGIDFLKALTTAYMQRNVAKKNYLAEKSIEYIDSQIGVISDSLKENESDLQQFRSNNKLTEIKSLSSQTMQGANKLEEQKDVLEAKARYYSYVYNNLDNDQGSTNLLVPSSMGVEDQLLSGIVQQYIQYTIERNNLVQDKKTLSPYFSALNNKIKSQKKTLLETLQSQMTANSILLNSINNQLARENQKLRDLPGTERQLVQIERKQILHDDIYKYMLRKKAEAQIAKGSNLPDNDIIEPAKLTSPHPVSPNKLANIVTALFLGIAFPYGVIGVRSLLNNTIRDEEVLKTLTNLPLIGLMYKKQSKDDSSVFVQAPRSLMAESIRSVRTNIEFALGDERHKTIVFTSTTSGEGKSFCALNVAQSFSVIKRKTILLDFDLRKSKNFPFEVRHNLGITNYLSGVNTIEEIITPTGIPYLDFIAAGDKQFDLLDLINSDATNELIKKLKEQYDYVIIDTAPIGLVWEIFLLIKLVDLKIFVIRENVTTKSGFSKIINDLQNKKIQNLYCLLNDAAMTEKISKTYAQYFSNE